MSITKLLDKYPPKHGARTVKVKTAPVTAIALEDRPIGVTDWAKQANLVTGPPNQSLNDPIPVRGVTQVKKKKNGKKA